LLGAFEPQAVLPEGAVVKVGAPSVSFLPFSFSSFPLHPPSDSCRFEKKRIANGRKDVSMKEGMEGKEE
jgi:hypothetical protein